MAHVNFTLKLLAVTYSMPLSYYGTLIKLKAQFPNEIDKKIQCSCQKPLFISVNLVIISFQKMYRFGGLGEVEVEIWSDVTIAGQTTDKKER